MHASCTARWLPAPATLRDGDMSRQPLGEILSRAFADPRGGSRLTSRADFLNAPGASSAFAPIARLGGRYPWQVGSDNRLRILSLWRSGAGSLSLQGGHGREASLQWTVPLGTGTYRQGVLDSWLGQSP